jgi:transposase-like protein
MNLDHVVCPSCRETAPDSWQFTVRHNSKGVASHHSCTDCRKSFWVDWERSASFTNWESFNEMKEKARSDDHPDWEFLPPLDQPI